MITGIETINQTNQAALNSALSTLVDALASLENSIRGNANTTVVSDRKSKVHPPTLEESLVIITPQEQTKFLEFSRQMPRLKQGSFRINDVVIPVNPEQDTFITILEKITNSSAGVTASFDSERNRLTIEAKDDGEMISLTNDTSNFLMESNVKVGSYLGSTDAPLFNINDDSRTVPNVLSNIEYVNGALNDLFTDTLLGEEVVEDVQGDFIDTIGKNEIINPSVNRFYLNWGLNINFHPDLVQPISIVRDAVVKTLSTDSASTVRFYSGDQTDKGFIARAQETIIDAKNRQAIDITA